MTTALYMSEWWPAMKRAGRSFILGSEVFECLRAVGSWTRHWLKPRLWLKLYAGWLWARHHRTRKYTTRHWRRRRAQPVLLWRPRGQLSTSPPPSDAPTSPDVMLCSDVTEEEWTIEDHVMSQIISHGKGRRSGAWRGLNIAPCSWARDQESLGHAEEVPEKR